MGDSVFGQSKGRDQPKYFDLLNTEDRAKFQLLRETLSSQACRNCRNKRVETFSEMLAIVRTFCMRNQSDDWKRCLACGVCWYKQYLCINIRQFHLLIDKCKSSINGSLHRLSLVMIPNRVHCMNIIVDALPYLRDRPNEAREWSVREFQRPIKAPVFPFHTPYGMGLGCYSVLPLLHDSERKPFPCPQIESEPPSPTIERDSDREFDVPMVENTEALLEDVDWLLQDDGVIY